MPGSVRKGTDFRKVRKKNKRTVKDVPGGFYGAGAPL